MTTLAEVKVYGGITHGHNDKVYEDDEIKQLMGKKAGAYGRHWVYGDRRNDAITGWCGFEEANIMVVYAEGKEGHITFIGRSGLNECLKFLEQFDNK